MRSSTLTGLCGAVALGVGLVACHAPAGDGSPTPSQLPATRAPTQLPVPEVTSTAEPALIATPVGAGPVQPVEFEIQFRIALQDLSPGEYLIYETGDFTGPTGIYDFYYISLDGSSRGPLLSVSSADLLGVSANRGTKLWMAYGPRDGILMADLASQQVTQFAVGCDDAWIGTYAVHHSTFAFRCRDLDVNQDVRFIVSSDDWLARGYAFPPAPSGDVNSLLWLTADKIAIQPRLPRAATGESVDGTHCILTPADGTLRCWEQVPKWWVPASEASPDGHWVVVRYPEEPSGPWVSGLVTLACLEIPTQECAPHVIQGAGVLGANPRFVWAPDGHRLLMHDGCGEGDRASPIWIYDLDLDQTTKLSEGIGCYELSPGPWTASGQDLVLVDISPSDNQTAWLLSSQTGAMRELTTGIDGILGFPGSFTVP